MDKLNFNWRYLAAYALFMVGCLFMALAFGEDDLPLSESAIIHAVLFGMGYGVFHLLGMCMKRWHEQGKINDRHKNS